MSARNKQRLAKVEQALTPKQAVIAFLRDQVREFHNVMDYLATNRRLPVDELPRPKICRRVAESVRSRLQGQGVPEDVIRRSVREATMDADFLLALTMVCNQVILDDRARNRLRLALLAQGLRFMLFRQSVAQSVGKTAKRKHAAKLCAGVDDEEVREWRDAATAFVADLCCLKEAVRLIECRYFDETPVLLGEMGEELGEQIEGAKALVTVYCETFGAATGSRSRRRSGTTVPHEIDLAEIERGIRPCVGAKATYLVDRAKADTLWNFDDVQGALNLLWQYESGEQPT